MKRGLLFAKSPVVCVLLALFVPATSQSQSIISNSGFDNGTSSWTFYTNGGGAFSTTLQSGNRVGVVSISKAGSNVQLYQAGLVLESNKRYRLTFLAYSNTGHDVSLYVQKHGSPYSSYGLDATVVDLATTWTTYSIEFVASGFSGTTNDVRLRIWFASSAVKNDTFYFDDIVLAKVTSDPPLITTQPSSATVAEGQTASFSIVASGGLPLSFQWQKNGTNISGATISVHNTPPTTIADSGLAFRCVVSNSTGTVTSNSAILRVTGTAPSISSHPVSQVILEGQTATFSIVANGTTPLTYQWQRNGTNIPAADSSIYNISSVALTDSGVVFRCIVANAYGSATSLPAVLHVNPVPPAITSEPSNTTVTDGQDATFSVTATGSQPLRYQWQRNALNLAGATQSSFILDTTTMLDNGASFRCIVSNAAGVDTSRSATLTVLGTPPSISSHPQPQTVTVGQSVSFSIVASGTQPLNYQWHRNGASIAEATNFTYTLTTVMKADSGSEFRCVVSNSAGTVTSNPALLTVPGNPPIILRQPTDQTVDEGDSVTFTISVSGTLPIFFQWQRDGVNLAGATDSVYRILAATLADSGAAFQCVVTNSVGTDTSSIARLHVGEVVPTIITQPLSQIVGMGSSVNFSVSAIGSGILAFQWQRNGADIAGADSAAFIILSLSLSDSGASFRCIAMNAYGSDTSDVAILSVLQPLTIITQPRDVAVAIGQSVTFSITVGGSGPLVYQWKRNNQLVDGATDSTFTLSLTTVEDHGATFQCIVSNPITTVASRVALLTVSSPPHLVMHPAHVTVAAGQSATFIVSATGSRPSAQSKLLLHWYRHQLRSSQCSDMRNHYLLAKPAATREPSPSAKRVELRS